MNKYLSFIFASVLTLTGVQLSKASNPSDSLAIVSAKWERTSSLQGIQLKQASIEGLFGGKQSISILTIGRAEGYTAFIATTDSLTTTSQLAEQSRSSAAINGSYFSIKEGFSTCYLRKNEAVIDTTTTEERHLRVNGAVHMVDNNIRIIPWNDENEKKGFPLDGDILASGPLLMQDGKTCDFTTIDREFSETRHPRSAIALTKEGDIMLVAVDGRAEGHADGMSIAELAYLLRILKAHCALNLDGGGSTTLWVNGQVVNHPSDNKKFDNKGERKVHLTAQILRFGIKLRQKKKLLHKLCRVRRRYRLVIAAHNISEHLEAYRRSRYYKNVRSVQRDRFFQYLSYASHIISPFYPSHTLMCSSSLLSSGSSATVHLAVTVYRSPSADASSGTFISQ